MRILFSISYYSPYVSGLTICAQRLAEEFAKKNKITVLTTRYDKSLRKEETFNKVIVKRMDHFIKISKGFIIPGVLKNALIEIKENDLVVINLPQFEGFIFAFLCKLFQKPVITIYHCEVVLPKGIINNCINFLLNISNFLILILSDKVVAYTKDYAISTKARFFKHKLFYIYPPIPKPNVNNKTKKNINKKIPKGRIVLGVAARVAAEKGLEFLFDAIPQLKKKLRKPFIIAIAGPKQPVGEEEYLKKMNGFLQKYGKEIIFLDTIPANNMGSFYSLLDVLVLPSINSTEAFGMVQVEAMLCGVPVVASNLPGVRVPIQKTGMGELSVVGDSYDIAEKIIKVLRNKKEYIKQKKIVNQIFSLHDTIQKYEEVFTAVS